MPTHGENSATWDLTSGDNLILNTSGTKPTDTSGGTALGVMQPSTVVLYCIKT